VLDMDKTIRILIFSLVVSASVKTAGPMVALRYNGSKRISILKHA
jgi:hypothetical protein